MPQISEHCPLYSPIRLGVINNWLRRPGKASALTPIEGTVHEWITSLEDASSRVVIPRGILSTLLLFSKRKVDEVSINLLTSSVLSEAYS